MFWDAPSSHFALRLSEPVVIVGIEAVYAFGIPYGNDPHFNEYLGSGV